MITGILLTDSMGRINTRGGPPGRRGAIDHRHTVNRLNGEDKHKKGADWEERGNRLGHTVNTVSGSPLLSEPITC